MSVPPKLFLMEPKAFLHNHFAPSLSKTNTFHSFCYDKIYMQNNRRRSNRYRWVSPPFHFPLPVSFSALEVGKKVTQFSRDLNFNFASFLCFPSSSSVIKVAILRDKRRAGTMPTDVAKILSRFHYNLIE